MPTINTRKDRYISNKRGVYKRRPAKIMLFEQKLLEDWGAGEFGVKKYAANNG